MRSREELEYHYRIERELADRLRNANRAERALLYGRVYDELFQRVPLHPQLTRREDARARAMAVTERLALLRRFLGPETVFLEIGAGDSSLCRQTARYVKQCYALDVSREILKTATEPNMQTILSDGCSIPVPPESVTLAYSYQVMEHIHPDDAVEQLQNIFRALAPGGVYLCVTPSRLNGPHDVSRYFDSVARGFHLKEYTFTELAELFRRTGFRQARPFVGLSHRYFEVSLPLLTALEALLERLPVSVRRWLGNMRGFQNLLFVSLAGIK
jgi:SAM-dependent methyltransferase